MGHIRNRQIDIVVDDCVCESIAGAQVAIDFAAQQQLDRLVRFVVAVIDDDQVKGLGVYTTEHKRTRATGKVSGRHSPDGRGPAADRVVDRNRVGRNQFRDSIRCIDRHADRHRRGRLTARRSVVIRYDTEIDYRRRESDGALICLGTPVAVRVQIRVIVAGSIVDRVRTVRR